MSFVEALTNVAVGYVIAVVTQIVVFPLFGLVTSFGETMAIGAVFTGISIVRSFTLRRLFEAIRVGQRKPPPAGGSVQRRDSQFGLRP